MSWRLNSTRKLILTRNWSPLRRNSIVCKPIVGVLPQQNQFVFTKLIKTNQQISWFSTSNLVRSGSKNDDDSNSDDKNNTLDDLAQGETAEIREYEMEKELLAETPGKFKNIAKKFKEKMF